MRSLHGCMEFLRRRLLSLLCFFSVLEYAISQDFARLKRSDDMLRNMINVRILRDFVCLVQI